MNQGRRSRNIRIVEYDVASRRTGAAIYLSGRGDRRHQRASSRRLPGAAGRGGGIAATSQRRNRAATSRRSAIMAIDDHRFLVIERDGRGVSVENPANLDVVNCARGEQADFPN